MDTQKKRKSFTTSNNIMTLSLKLIKEKGNTIEEENENESQNINFNIRLRSSNTSNNMKNNESKKTKINKKIFKSTKEMKQVKSPTFYGLVLSNEGSKELEVSNRKSISSKNTHKLLGGNYTLHEDKNLGKIPKSKSNLILGLIKKGKKEKVTIDLGSNKFKKTTSRSKKELFIDLVSSSIRSINFQKYGSDLSFSFKNNLIIEIKKQPEVAFKQVYNKERRGGGNIQQCNYYNDSIKYLISNFASDEKQSEIKRDLNKIAFCLKNFKGVSKFLKFHNIDDECLIQAGKFLVYKEYYQDEYIYKEHDKASGLYIIISGKVQLEKTDFIFSFLLNSIQNNKSIENEVNNPNTLLGIDSTPLNTTNKKVFKLKKHSLLPSTDKENKIKQSPNKKNISSNENQSLPFFSDGDIFGYSELIHQKKRSNCVIVKSQVLKVAHMSYSSFSQCFQKELLRSEYERKDFLIKNNTLCKNMDLNRMNILFDSVEHILLNNGEYFFCEGSEKVNLIVILYQGQAVLEKKYIKGYDESYKEALKEDMVFSSSKIMYLTSGDIVGLESLNDEKRRRFSMKATSSFASGLCINYNEITKELRMKLKENLEEYIKNIENAHKGFYLENLKIQKRDRINFKSYSNLKEELYSKDVKMEKIEKYIKKLNINDNVTKPRKSRQVESYVSEGSVEKENHEKTKKEEGRLNEKVLGTNIVYSNTSINISKSCKDMFNKANHQKSPDIKKKTKSKFSFLIDSFSFLNKNQNDKKVFSLNSNFDTTIENNNSLIRRAKKIMSTKEAKSNYEIEENQPTFRRSVGFLKDKLNTNSKFNNNDNNAISIVDNTNHLHQQQVSLYKKNSHSRPLLSYIPISIYNETNTTQSSEWEILLSSTSNGKNVNFSNFNQTSYLEKSFRNMSLKKEFPKKKNYDNENEQVKYIFNEDLKNNLKEWTCFEKNGKKSLKSGSFSLPLVSNI